jgi:hypothetical protein
MIAEYPLEHRRCDQSEYEPFWAAAEALDLPLSLHTATRRQGKMRGAGEKTLRAASSRATKALYPALSMCDLIFSGVFERHRRLTLAIGPTALVPLHRLRRDGAGEAPQFSRASSGARNSRNTGDHLACSGPLEEWPRSLSSSK